MRDFFYILFGIKVNAHLMRKPNDGSVNTNVFADQIISQDLKIIPQSNHHQMLHLKTIINSDIVYSQILECPTLFLVFLVFVAELLLPARHFQ